MNFFTTRLCSFLLCSSYIFFLHAMEIQKLQKPIIKAFISPIDCPHYAPQAYHDHLNKIGFNSFRFIPVIKVNVRFAAQSSNSIEYEWTNVEHTHITLFEKEHCYYTKQKLQNAPNFENNSNQQKFFPAAVPITLFHNKKEGDIVSLQIHGYPAELICTYKVPTYDFQYEKDKIKDEDNFNTIFKKTIKDFSIRTEYTLVCEYYTKKHKIFFDNYLNFTEEDKKYFYDNQILEIIKIIGKSGAVYEIDENKKYPGQTSITYKHGNNCFKSMEQLIAKTLFYKISQKASFGSILLMKLLYDHQNLVE